MRGTVEEAVEVCERVLARTNVASHALPPLAAQVEGLQEEVQAELVASGLVVSGVQCKSVSFAYKKPSAS